MHLYTHKCPVMGKKMTSNCNEVPSFDTGDSFHVRKTYKIRKMTAIISEIVCVFELVSAQRPLGMSRYYRNHEYKRRKYQSESGKLL